MKQKTGAWHDGHLDKPKNQIKPGNLKGNVLPNAEIPNGSAPYRMVDLSLSPPKNYAGSWDIRAFGGSGGKGRANLGFKWFAYDEGVYRVKIKLQCFNRDPAWPHHLTIVRYPEGTEWKQVPVLPGEHTLEYEFYRDEIPWYVKTSGNRHWGINLHFTMLERLGGAKARAANGIHVRSIEVEGPINKVWPPVHRRQVFPVRPAGVGDEAYARLVLEPFMKRAFRRPVSKADVERMLRLYRAERKAGKPFLQAMRLPLTTVLCSPDFLYISGPRKRQPAAHALASRLSYFLWRSMPDDELMAVAAGGDLARHDVLKAQMIRMLEDPRSDALVENFTRQWLGLRKIRNLQADRQLYPGYRLALQQAMVAESEAFFRHVLDNSLPVRLFIHSDFAMLNGEMARHYGIPGVRGDAFRKVSLPAGSPRGGVLGQASVLTATSNGVRTLPVTRGVFILEHLLGSPPPSPPPDVGQLEDVKAPRPDATTRERLELHRTNPNCARCHEKIDPLGFALENFDAVGQWRTHEMKFVQGQGHKQGAKVEANGQLPDGRRFGGVVQLKKLLLEDEQRFVQCLAEKMLVYALDRPIGFADRRFVDELCGKINANGATLSAMIEQIVISEPFTSAGGHR
jgi:hypothetical protein